MCIYLLVFEFRQGMSKGGNEVLAGLVVFVVASVALVHAWDKYWDDRASARESVLRHEHLDAVAAGLSVVEREPAIGRSAWTDDDRFD